MDDHKFLDRVTNSLSTIASNSEKLGCHVLELRLNLYKHYRNCPKSIISTNLKSIIRLIAHSRFVKLDLRTETFCDEGMSCEEGVDIRHGLGFINAAPLFDPCYEVLMNLQEFSFYVVGCYSHLFTGGYSVLKFKNLTSLHLSNCFMIADLWQEYSRTFDKHWFHCA